MTLFWFLLAGLFLLALLWFCIEQHLLLVRRQTISLRRLPPEWDGLRILQITDIHRRELGRDHRRIVRSAVRQKPDCIVLTGDIISRDMTEYGAVFALLGNSAPCVRCISAWATTNLTCRRSAGNRCAVVWRRQAAAFCATKQLCWGTAKNRPCIWQGRI